MNKYEAMFLIKPDLTEEDKKNLLQQMKDLITKHGGTVAAFDVWAERKKLCYPIKHYAEATYYLMNFELAPLAITEINALYKINENILRFLISRLK